MTSNFTIRVLLCIGLAIATTLSLAEKQGGGGKQKMGHGGMMERKMDCDPPDCVMKKQRAEQRSDIYGNALMTEEERAEYRKKIKNAKTKEERNQIKEQHRKEIQDRARQQGVTLSEDTAQDE